jgi:predicted small metal-binding protein
VAESEDEILTQAAEHAQTVHGLKEITPQVVEAVKGAIQES